ncbi:MAG: asparagine synthase (glutamine-hydrolyzing) [Leeuwenhoekiella sp.]
MCGIAGITSKTNKRSALNEMLDAQKHRGPDYTGVYIDENYAFLGHNRLSVIDLSPEANQPFIDKNQRYQLVFNGEIYNYIELRESLKIRYDFKTQSDTEVLLAAYITHGENCLELLNGMFAFAIWDSKEKELFAARDRFGVKPLYYAFNGDDFYFASEIKSICAAISTCEPNRKVWANYFLYGSYGLPEETFYNDILQLPAGNSLILKNEKLTIKSWYNFVKNVQNTEKIADFKAAQKHYLKILKDAINLRFRADVPIGFNVSGGLDSSLLLALVNNMHEGKHIKAYTFYTGDERYDELPWVQKMLETVENPLQKVKLKSSEVKDYAQKLANNQDEPFGGVPTIAYAKIFEQARKDGVLVLLDGQGMDEQWAGYDYYSEAGENSIIQGMDAKISPYKSGCIGQKLAKYAEKPAYPTPFDNRLQNIQYRDLFYTKLPRALRFNDRISMANSTELREPFLDYRLVEFAFAQQAEFKIKGDVHKYFLRELVKDLLTQELTCAPKRPLQTPQREWFASDLKPFINDQIQNLKKSSYADWFDIDAIESELIKYEEGDNESSFHVWQWVNFSLLYKS